MLSFCDSHHKIYNFFEELPVANPARGVVALIAALFRNDTVFPRASAAPRTARWHDAQLIGRKFTLSKFGRVHRRRNVGQVKLFAATNKHRHIMRSPNKPRTRNKPGRRSPGNVINRVFESTGPRGQSKRQPSADHRKILGTVPRRAVGRRPGRVGKLCAAFRTLRTASERGAARDRSTTRAARESKPSAALRS